MEENRSAYPNRIQISQFGATFLRQLPAELTQMQHQQDENKENSPLLTPCIRKRGQGIDFHEFARQTQTTIHKELSTMLRRGGGDVSDKRKQLVHHDNWTTEQRIIKNKLTDAHLRLEQAKLSQYDWQREKQTLNNLRTDILGHWEAVHLGREKRLLSKLKKIMERKYPGRTASCVALRQLPRP